ncbi:hypothetical protein BCR32DRAFT_279273 [Anaeromyces robustus]|uniref:Uncharacterized protein n=1 Tax=Anaeromyces robustus TaxID=1754192 RepID=A0A1Y1X8F9_9FUNG|nr:hypothetical protein BCR32DRAFT_279273 [Anaeromyces robustus]|eukprot:ORX82033.1 hypothetical protein BCR32DRAFT_279273 [Anaeromyces robustus]
MRIQLNIETVDIIIKYFYFDELLEYDNIKETYEEHISIAKFILLNITIKSGDDKTKKLINMRIHINNDIEERREATPFMYSFKYLNLKIMILLIHNGC